MSELAFESVIDAGMTAVLTAAGINAVAGRPDHSAASFPRVLVKTDDVEPLASSGADGTPRAWSGTVYLYCDTYFHDDQDGAANASLMRSVRGCTATGLKSSLAAKTAGIAFFAAYPIKDYSADEVHVRRTVLEIAVHFTTAQTQGENL